jgi:hypothetical protein
MTRNCAAQEASAALRFGSEVASSQDRPDSPRNQPASIRQVLWTRRPKMKHLFFLFVVCVVCAAGANAQVSGSISSQAQPWTISGNPQHATQTDMATPYSLMERSGTVSAHGERPLWEFAIEAPVVPLGDSARELRKEHAAAKKAAKVWTN